MPLRYGKETRRRLFGRVMRRLKRLRLTYNDEILTTRERKAIKQMLRTHRVLETAVQRYASRVEPGASAVIVHTYEDGAAFELEVLRGDGSTVAVTTVRLGTLLSIEEDK